MLESTDGRVPDGGGSVTAIDDEDAESKLPIPVAMFDADPF